jgi:hypothetical protein
MPSAFAALVLPIPVAAKLINNGLQLEFYVKLTRPEVIRHKNMS